MKITADIVHAFIEKKYDGELDLSNTGTWDPRQADRHDLADLLHFYNNSFRAGLIEPPEKNLRPRPYPYDTLHVGFFLKKYLWPKISLLEKKQASAFRRDFDLLCDSGLRFPAFDPVHSEFYYSFRRKEREGTSIFFFNANIRKYAIFNNFIASHAASDTIKNVCEIGGGYGGMCEFFLLNNNTSRYFIIDLFETLSVAMTYLSNSRSAKGYGLVYLESLEELRSLDEGGKYIIFVSFKNYQRFLKSGLPRYGHIELFINTHSLVETSKNIIADYFEFMQSFSDTHFFSSNAEHRREKNEMLSAYDFPYDAKWRHIHETLMGDNVSRMSVR
ncbi:MAG TPA: putative sugar O-methyltransferase [Candidatus Paceibacterota bacterium]